jgi:multidrug efflux system membrane fusion protein
VIKPQVQGRVVTLAVAEGTDVEAGQLLITLDDRPFEAALKQAEANLARSRALAVNAQYVLDRNRRAIESQAASEAELEIAKAQAAAADADVLSNQAQVDNAKVNLSYCKIVAPLTGRLGQFMVKPGSIVKANETELVDIAQIDPIEVAFALPEESLAGVRDAMLNGPVRVEVRASREGAEPVVGELTFADNKVDVQTGTMRFKATFKNGQIRLWPGLFVSVAVILGHDADGVVVPESAVQVTQEGLGVFVVKPDQSVELRNVTLRRTADGKSVLNSGVQPGETVVTDGQLRLAQGVKVEPRPEIAPSPTQAKPGTN